MSLHDYIKGTIIKECNAYGVRIHGTRLCSRFKQSMIRVSKINKFCLTLLRHLLQCKNWIWEPEAISLLG